MSTGGDHTCSSLILWDSSTWTMCSKMQAHTAAVTCIVDMRDGRTLATGSYDQKITLYDYRRSVIVVTMTAKAKVACMVINANGTKLVSSGLDNSFTVWSIVRKLK